MTPVALIACLALAANPPSATASAPAGPAYVIVFDFKCPANPAMGVQLADSVRTRLARAEEFKPLDRLTTQEVTPEGGLDLDSPDQKILPILKDNAAALAIVGVVQKAGETIRLEARCIDASGKAGWKNVFSDSTERARGEIARQLVEFLRNKAEWKPPEYGDQAEPKDFGKPLNVNGDFETGAAGWRGPDNVSSFLIPDPRTGHTGAILRLFTDLEREAWLKYQQDLRLGKADPQNPPKIGTVDNKYATVAGMEGVVYRSDWIAAKAGQRYWLTADMKGQTADIFFPKIFVKGFADQPTAPDGLSDVSLNDLKLSPADLAAMPKEKRDALVAEDAQKHPDRYRREVYRWYLACRDEDNTWRHFAAPFPPRGGLPANVQYLRIEILAYWPPGEFLFDNVHLYADPHQKGALPEEPARTPGKKSNP